jgi:hypothetical protein
MTRLNALAYVILFLAWLAIGIAELIYPPLGVPSL